MGASKSQMGSIGKNDSNHKMNLRAKPNITRMVITKARAMTFGLGGKLKLLFIRNALFSLFILLDFCTKL